MLFYLTAYTTLLSAILGLFFSIRAVKKGKSIERTNALYMFARCLALVCISLIPLFTKSTNLLIIITCLMLIIQIIDGFIGLYMKECMTTIGPFIMAFLHAVCLYLSL